MDSPFVRSTTITSSGANSFKSGADCVETGSVPGVVLIRDTKDRERGPVLRVSPEAWRVFTRGVKGRN